MNENIGLTVVQQLRLLLGKHSTFSTEIKRFQVFSLQRLFNEETALISLEFIFKICNC